MSVTRESIEVGEERQREREREREREVISRWPSARAGLEAALFVCL